MRNNIRKDYRAKEIQNRLVIPERKRLSAIGYEPMLSVYAEQKARNLQESRTELATSSTTVTNGPINSFSATSTIPQVDLKSFYAENRYPPNRIYKPPFNAKGEAEFPE